MTAVPVTLLVTYQVIANLVRRRMAALSHLDRNPFFSLCAWGKKLVSQGWHVRSLIPDNGSEISFCFFSPWQKDQFTRFGHDLVCLDSTHNTTSNFPHFLDLKLSLFTFLILSPVTGKGTPVIWLLSSNEKACVLRSCFLTQFTLTLHISVQTRPPLAAVLRWLRREHQFCPKVFMTDCDTSLKLAINTAYADIVHAPQVVWCFWHVLRAVRRTALKKVRALRS